MTSPESYHPTQDVAVYRAAQVRVANGANFGDGLSIAEDLVAGDIYRVSPVAVPVRLGLVAGEHAEAPFTVAPDTGIGTPGAALHLDCALIFMCGDGSTTEALVLVETDAKDDIEAIYLLPLAPMHPRADYALVGIDREGARRRFAQVACVSFTRGTAITLATGEQRPVESLAVGDMVLTRDDGPQAIRWIGRSTVRAVGAFAPVVIRAGVLNNRNDLRVSPDHRLFVYQRSDRLGAGRPELLVRARHLVNGDSVFRQDGGFVDYFQLLFDRHQIIYAEGIAAESLLVDTRTRAALPPELSDPRGGLTAGHRGTEAAEIEVREALLRRADAAEVLRRSSGG